jgi:hypothetical protein
VEALNRRGQADSVAIFNPECGYALSRQPYPGTASPDTEVVQEGGLDKI